MPKSATTSTVSHHHPLPEESEDRTEQSKPQPSSLDELLYALTDEPENMGIQLLMNHIQQHDGDDATATTTSEQQRRQITSLLRRTSVELFQHIEI